MNSGPKALRDFLSGAVEAAGVEAPNRERVSALLLEAAILHALSSAGPENLDEDDIELLARLGASERPTTDDQLGVVFENFDSKPWFVQAVGESLCEVIQDWVTNAAQDRAEEVQRFMSAGS